MSEAQNGGNVMGNVNCLRCHFRHEDNGNCTAVGGFCTAVSAAHCPLLREYLDTELTPEEIDMDHEAAEQLRHLCRDCDLDRLEKLAEADKAGRLVVLPCKVGDTVYRIVRDADPHITRDEVRNMYFADDMTLCVELVGGRIILSEKFGKTVFLTREEAEKALEAMKDE